jgi:hypothetical protein
MCTGAQRERNKTRRWSYKTTEAAAQGNMSRGVLYINAEKYGSSAIGNTTK